MRQKKQIPWKTIGLTLLAGLVGGAAGYWGMCQVDALGLPGLLVLLLLLVLAYVLQVVVHDRALSFRIGRMLLVKLDGRWKLRAYHIPGTGGQCLMAPPAQERPPYRLYHLGGGLANLLLAALALPVFLRTGAPLLRVFAGALVLIGGWIAGTNLIPMKMGGVANDGYNARNLGKDPLALQCSCVQLWIVEALQEGYSLADMPEEWFALPPKADLQNVLIMGTAIQRASRLMARGELEEADRAIRELLCGGHDLLGLHRLELTAGRPGNTAPAGCARPTPGPCWRSGMWRRPAICAPSLSGRPPGTPIPESWPGSETCWTGRTRRSGLPAPRTAGRRLRRKKWKKFKVVLDYLQKIHSFSGKKS